MQVYTYSEARQKLASSPFDVPLKRVLQRKALVQFNRQKDVGPQIIPFKTVNDLRQSRRLVLRTAQSGHKTMNHLKVVKTIATDRPSD
jgi:hypothetical protein